jgi:hypothetical protein
MPPLTMNMRERLAFETDTINRAFQHDPTLFASVTATRDSSSAGGRDPERSDRLCCVMSELAVRDPPRSGVRFR